MGRPAIKYSAVAQFAMKQADLTESEMAVVMNHPATHDCALCAKFERYMRVKGTVEAWRVFQASLDDILTGSG